MPNPHLRAQRRIDIACGYALGSYIGVTLAWVSMLVGSGFALFALLIAGVAGLFGTLRTIIGMKPRFWITPLFALLYTKLALVCLYYEAGLVLMTAGMAFTAAFTLPIIWLFKHDFARSIPPWVCKGCGYPLTGLPGPRCPECGVPFDPYRVPTNPALSEHEA